MSSAINMSRSRTGQTWRRGRFFRVNRHGQSHRFFSSTCRRATTTGTMCFSRGSCTYVTRNFTRRAASSATNGRWPTRNCITDLKCRRSLGRGSRNAGGVFATHTFGTGGYLTFWSSFHLSNCGTRGNGGFTATFSTYSLHN